MYVPVIPLNGGGILQHDICVFPLNGWVHRCSAFQYRLLWTTVFSVQIRLVVWEKRKNRTLYFRKMMSLSRRLGATLITS